MTVKQNHSVAQIVIEHHKNDKKEQVNSLVNMSYGWLPEEWIDSIFSDQIPDFWRSWNKLTVLKQNCLNWQYWR